MEYIVEISETLSKRVNISADSEKDAIRQAKKMYLKSEIVLSADDFVGYEMIIKENQIF